MSRVFPPNSRSIALKALIGLLLFAGLAVAGTWYYATPKWYRAGYQPTQPITFSHKLHAAQIGLDCLVCHSHVKESYFSNVPDTQVCWNCHGSDKGNIKSDSPLLAPLREAHQTGQPIAWVRIHKVPDFVYFNHAAHVNRNVSCVSCHGRVDEMVTVRHEQPLSMSWCLDCHRNPAPNLRPNDQVTNLKWEPANDPRYAGMSRQQVGEKIAEQARIRPPTDCTTCHR